MLPNRSSETRLALASAYATVGASQLDAGRFMGFRQDVMRNSPVATASEGFYECAKRSKTRQDWVGASLLPDAPPSDVTATSLNNSTRDATNDHGFAL